MKKIVRLTESDLTNIVERVIKETKHSKDVPKNDLNLMVKELRKNEIGYGWSLNKNWLNITGTDYRIYLNDNGTYRVQDANAKHREDKIHYTSPKFGPTEKQTPERNTSDGAEHVVNWLKKWE
jgi:hypothetical protein